MQYVYLTIAVLALLQLVAIAASLARLAVHHERFDPDAEICVGQELFIQSFGQVAPCIVTHVLEDGRLVVEPIAPDAP